MLTIMCFSTLGLPMQNQQSACGCTTIRFRSILCFLKASSWSSSPFHILSSLSTCLLQALFVDLLIQPDADRAAAGLQLQLQSFFTSALAGHRQEREALAFSCFFIGHYFEPSEILVLQPLVAALGRQQSPPQ